MSDCHLPDFALTNAVLAPTPKVEITEQDFRSLESDLAHIDTYIEIEEIWDSLLSNYRALELALAEMGVDNVLMGGGNSIHDFDETRRACTRLVDNLLTTARAFLDKTPGRVRLLFGRPAQRAFRLATNKAYDIYSGYKFMDNLRNYAQHNGSSISGVTYNVSRQHRGEGPDALVHNAQIGIDRCRLERAFKQEAREVLDRVSDAKGKIDILPLVRQYMQGLDEVMQIVRETAKEPLEAWLANNDQAVSKLADAGGLAVGQVAVRFSEEGTYAETVQLHPLARERLKRLRSRNRSLKHLTRSQIVN
jgi:hypothetical protein